MEQFVIYLALVLFGACFGSFAGATVWRLRARQLVADKAEGEPYDKKEYARLKSLAGGKALKDRSCCLGCGHGLKWYELIPVVSWLALRGKCRSCKKFIGWFELLIELGVVAFFVLSYAFWPGGFDGSTVQVVHFILWLVAGVIMAVLYAYDAKWFLLPDGATIMLAIVGALVVGVTAVASGDVWGTILAALGAVSVLGGLYALLYAVSRGRWVGFGDVKLGAALGLLLVSWELALLALFLANFIGCLVVIPGLATKKLTRTSHVPFGPLLILGAVLAFIFGTPILDAYYSLMGL